MVIKKIALNNINSDTESTRLRKLTDLITEFVRPFSRLRITGNNIIIGKSNLTYSSGVLGGDYATAAEAGGSYDFNIDPKLSLDAVGDLYIMNTTNTGSSGSDPANTTLVVIAY